MHANEKRLMGRLVRLMVMLLTVTVFGLGWGQTNTAMANIPDELDVYQDLPGIPEEPNNSAQTFKLTKPGSISRISLWLYSRDASNDVTVTLELRQGLPGQTGAPLGTAQLRINGAAGTVPGWRDFIFPTPIPVTGGPNGDTYHYVILVSGGGDVGSGRLEIGYITAAPGATPYADGDSWYWENLATPPFWQREDYADLTFRVYLALNRPPVLATNAGLTVNEGATATVANTNLNITDPDGDTITYTIGTAPRNGTLRKGATALSAGGTFTQADINGGQITYAHNDSETTEDSFTFTAADGNGGTIGATTFPITVNPVNDPPTFNLGADVTVLEDSGAFTQASFLTDASAIEPGQTLTTTVSNNNNSLFSVQPAINGSVTLTFTPAPNAHGEATVTVTVRDNGGTANGGSDSTSKTFKITVTGVNDPPSFTVGPNVSVNEDAGPQTVSNWATGISAGPHEPDQTVSFTVTNNNNALFTVQPAVGPTGTLTFTSAPDANGVATVTIIAKDNGGTTNGGVDTSAPQTFTITVVAVNDPPIANPDRVTGTHEDSEEIQIFVVDLLANDRPGPETATDEADQTLTIIGVANGTGGTVRMADGNIYFTPAANFWGDATFTYTLQDSEGATATGIVTVPVSPVADVPTATGATTDEDTQTTSGLVLSRNAVDGAEVTHFWITGITNGRLYHNDGITEIANEDFITVAEGNAGLKFTPGADLNSSDTTFGFTVAAAISAAGAGLSDSVFVPVTVNPVNDPPTAVDDTLDPVAEDSGPWRIPFTALTDNDIKGPANESEQTLTIVAVSDPVGGTVAIEETDVIFTPTAHFNGTASFTYTVQDSGAAPNTDTATVRFTVTEVNDPPEPTDDVLSAVDEDSEPRMILIASLVANDMPGPLGAVDESDQELTFVSVGSPVGGTVKIEGEHVIFELTPDFHGTASFIYTVRDNGTTNGRPDPKEASATVAFTVNPVAEAPTITSATTAEDTQSTEGLVITPDEADGAGVTHYQITGITGGRLYQTNGTTEITNGGFITAAQGAAGLKFTPAPDLNTPAGDTFGFTVQAAFDAVGTGIGPGTTASITVTEVNDAPTAVDDTMPDQLEDTTVTILVSHLLANDSAGPANESGQELTVTIDETYVPVGGTVAFNRDGDVVFTPTLNYYGPASFRYILTDNGTTAGEADPKSSTAIVSFEITPVPDAPQITAAATNEDETTIVTLEPNAADLTGVTHFVLTGVTGGILYLEGAPLAVNGQFTLAAGADGLIFAPEPDRNSPADGANYFTVSFAAHDAGRILTGEASTATIRVNEVNDAPTAVAEQLAAVDEDSAPFTISADILLANDLTGPSNESDQTLTVTAVEAIDGIAEITLDDDDQTITIKLEPDFFGDAWFRYTVTDDGTTNGAPDHKSATTIVRIPVNPRVDVPSVTAVTTAEDTLSGPITITRHPKDGAEVTHYLISEITGGTLYLADGISPVGNGTSITYAQGTAGLRFLPAADLNSPAGHTFSFKVQASSATGAGTSAAVTATITVTEVNDAPIGVDDVLDGTYLEDHGPFLIPFADLTANDLHGGLDEGHQNLTVLIDSAMYGTVSIEGSNVRFMPIPDFNGTAWFTYFVRDNGTTDGAPDPKSAAAPATVTFTITPVNDAPSFTKGADQVVDEDSGPHSVAGWATGISAGPANESSQTVSFLVSNNNNALFSVQPAISPTGTLTYALAPHANGTATVTVRIQDSGGTDNGGVDTSGEETFTITVTAVNDAPFFTKGADQEVREDAGEQIVTGWATGISAGAPNESNQILTFVVTNTNNALFAVQPAVSSDGTLTYTPAADAFGVAIVTVTLTDSGGTENGGEDTSADQTFTITVTSVNDAPSFTKGANQTVNEDSGPHSVAGWATDISAGPVNESSQTVSFLVSNNNNALFSVQPAISSTGTLTYALTPDANGSATVTVRIQDSGGTDNGGVDTSAAQIFTITVTAVNDAPFFSGLAGPQTAYEDTDLVLTGLTVSDVDAGTGTLTVTLSVSHGQVSPGPTLTGTLAELNAALASITYRADANYNGTDTLVLSVTDLGNTGAGGALTDSLTLPITVVAVNDVPSFTKGPDQAVLEDEGAQTIANWATAISAGPADESGQTLTFEVTTNNDSLFAVLPAVSPTGTLTYTPATNANGSATVTVTLKDNGGTAHGGVDTSAAQTFTIKVTAVNDAPSFTKGADQTVLEDAGLQSIPNWATAISAGPANEADQEVHFTVTNDNSGLFAVQPAIDANGTLTYTPADNAHGTATVTVTIHDDGGTENGGVNVSAPQTFVITVTPVNDAPTFTDAPTNTAQTIAENEGLQPLEAVDVDGDIITFTLTAGTLPEGITLNADGTFTGVASFQAAGVYTVTITLSDGEETTAGNLTITVLEYDTTPTLAPIADRRNAEGQTVSFTVIGGDIDGDTLTYSATGLPDGIGINAVTGEISGTLTYSSSGTHRVTVVVTDDTPTAGSPAADRASRTFTWSVANTNLAPIYTGPTSFAGAEGTEFSGSLSATDPDGDPVSFSVVGGSLPPGITLSGSTLSGKPTYKAAGSYSITVQVSDHQGARNQVTISITIANTDTTPTLAPIGNQENFELRYVALKASGQDEDGDTLTYSASGLPPGLSMSSNNGLISGTVSAGARGQYQVTVTVTDNTPGGPQGDSASQSFTWTIHEAHVQPPGKECRNVGVIGNPSGNPNARIHCEADEDTKTQATAGLTSAPMADVSLAEATIDTVAEAIRQAQHEFEAVPRVILRPDAQTPVQGAVISQEGLALLNNVGGDLAVETRQGTLVIPAAVLQKLNEGLEGGALVILFEDFVTEDLEEVELPHQQAKDMKPASPIIEVTVATRYASGDLERHHNYSVSLTLTLPLTDTEADEELAGMYRFELDGDGNIIAMQYVGGEAEGGSISVARDSLSFYGVVVFDREYQDVPETHWAHRAIKVMTARHVVQGVSDIHFDPERAVTRAEFATMVARAFGVPMSSTTQSFADVAADKWYAQVMSTVVQAGLFTPEAGNTLRPDEPITRQEMVVVIARAMERFYPSATLPSPDVESTLAPFKDQAEIDAGARDEMARLVAAGLVNGRTVDTLVPEGTTKRAEAATLIKRLLDWGKQQRR